MSGNKIRVAVKIRPLLAEEAKAGSKTHLHISPGKPQIMSDTSKFNFNFVFDSTKSQQSRRLGGAEVT